VTSFGIIGLGWIGRRVAVRLPGASAVLVRPAQAEMAANLVGGAAVCTSVADFIARRPAVALECALASVLAEIGADLLAAGIDLVPLSLTALCDPAVERRIVAAADAGPGRLELAPGAVGSLDLLATAREEGLRRVTYRQLKSPEMWKLTPAAGLANLDGIDRRSVFLSGSVRKVARLFPNNLNSSVGVALAGLGLDATELELVADPALSETAHELEIEAGAGKVMLSVGGREVAPDGDPADYTTSSLVRIVHRRRANLKI
jgi:aspartate dehydrogenase